MAKYSIYFRGGPYDGQMLMDCDMSHVKPGDKFSINGTVYTLLNTATAQLSYKEGCTPEGLACGAIYVEPELN